jgi:biuret amidohydrolase
MQVNAIDPTKTAMIVVDMQNDFVAPGGGLETPAARAMVPKLVEALRICRSAGIKVIYTTHVHRRDGSDMGLFVTYIHRSPIVPQWWMALRASRYTPK